MDHKDEEDEILSRINSQYSKWSTAESAAHELARMDAKFQELQQLAKLGHVPITKKPAGSNSSEQHTNFIMKHPKIRKVTSQDHISRKFVNCCMPGCDKGFFSGTCFYHFMTRHLSGDQKKVHHAYEGKPIEIEIPVKERVFHEMDLLALIAFDGMKNGIRPGKREIWITNDYINEQDLKHSLPVLVFYIWTNWNHATEGEVAEVANEEHNLLIIWAAVPPIKKPLYYMMTATGLDVQQKHTNFAAARRLVEDSQIAKEFIYSASNFLCLAESDVRVMTKQFKENLHLEITINENE